MTTEHYESDIKNKQPSNRLKICKSGLNCEKWEATNKLDSYKPMCLINRPSLKNICKSLIRKRLNMETVEKGGIHET